MEGGITIYHNGRCSKSRGALEILQEKGIEHEVRWYLSEPLTQVELRRLLKLLGIKASELIRRNEPYFIEHLKDKKLTQSEWLRELAKHPELIERPIVVNGDKAVIARPPEKVFDIL